jgi:hypothetical protein
MILISLPRSYRTGLQLFGCLSFFCKKKRYEGTEGKSYTNRHQQQHRPGHGDRHEEDPRLNGFGVLKNDYYHQNGQNGEDDELDFAHGLLLVVMQRLLFSGTPHPPLGGCVSLEVRQVESSIPGRQKACPMLK